MFKEKSEYFIPESWLTAKRCRYLCLLDAPGSAGEMLVLPDIV
jgi:hypothetical protein